MNFTAERSLFYGPFFGTLGVTAAQVLASFGAAYGIARSAIGISNMSIIRPDLVMKSIIPVIMAGIISIYGLVVSIILSGRIKPTGDGYRLGRSAAHLAAGLTCGFCGLGAGYAIGVVGEAGVRAHALQPRLFVTLVLILIFAEVLGLYGMIVSLIFIS